MDEVEHTSRLIRLAHRVSHSGLIRDCTVCQDRFARLHAAEARVAAAQLRADGGPVAPGESYLVGETGPESFVPDTDGQVIPNGLLR